MPASIHAGPGRRRAGFPVLRCGAPGRQRPAPGHNVPAAAWGRRVKTDYRVVVIGGGIVGTSVLYQLARLGWSDSALIERVELTVGSSWHAAGGFHALNDDPNIAALQAYTINLYTEIERE